MKLMDIIKHPLTGKAVIFALGALGMVGMQNTVPAVKNATIAQAGFGRAEIVEIMQELRNLPLGPVIVNNTIKK